MTPSQMNRMLLIAREIVLAKSHPSEKVKESVSGYDDEEMKKAATSCGKIIDEDDGYQAYKAISEWHKGGLRSVIAYLNTL